MKRLVFTAVVLTALGLTSGLSHASDNCSHRYEHCKRECYHSYGHHDHHGLNHCLNNCQHEYNSCLRSHHNPHHGDPMQEVLESIFGVHH